MINVILTALLLVNYVAAPTINEKILYPIWNGCIFITRLTFEKDLYNIEYIIN